MRDIEIDSKETPTLDYPAKRPTLPTDNLEGRVQREYPGASDAEIRETAALLRRVAFCFMHRTLCGCDLCLKDFFRDMPELVPLVSSYIQTIKARPLLTVPCRAWTARKRRERE